MFFVATFVEQLSQSNFGRHIWASSFMITIFVNELPRDDLLSFLEMEQVNSDKLGFLIPILPGHVYLEC